MAKIKIFQRTSTNIEISKTFWPKSKFSIISTRSEIFRIFFFLTKTNIFGNFVQNRNAQICWPKSNFEKILTKIEIFWQFWPKLKISKILTKMKFSKNLDENRHFLKILTNIEILQKNWLIWRLFRKLWPKSRFSDYFLGKSWFFSNFHTIKIIGNFLLNSGSSKILTKFDIISEIFNKNRDFRKSWLKSRFFENLDQCQDFQKFWRKSIFSENFDQNQHFWNFLPKLRIYKFWPKSRFSKILTKIKIIYNNFWQNSIISKVWPKSRLFEDKLRIPRILTEIEIFKNFDQNWNLPKNFTKINIFGKFCTKSRFFKNIDENQGSSKLLNEIKIFENFDQNWDYLNRNF